ncbi:hypothetical protein B0H14DRAFT_3453674 [Mycena olivaceomarginata]|nr:hypothetical protein B0H14DRAFT_3453674 [Mycena olivaceomarginata]
MKTSRLRHARSLLYTSDNKEEEEEEKRVKKEEMGYLAATRPPPVPLSPQRARQLFDHVLGPGAGTPPPSVAKASPQSSAASHDSPTTIPSPPQTPPRAGTFLEHVHQCTCQLQFHLPAYAEMEDLEAREAPGLERAVEVLQQTPGGELVFVGDERRLWEFLDEDS